MPMPAIPCACEMGQSLCASSSVLRFTTSSLSCDTCALSASFSLLKISTLACRFANHCFFRCRHLRAATLFEGEAGRVSGLMAYDVSWLGLYDVPISFEEILPLLLVCHLPRASLLGLHHHGVVIIIRRLATTLN